MIELDQLVKKFGNLTAVDHVSLKIPRGEFFAILRRATNVEMICQFEDN